MKPKRGFRGSRKYGGDSANVARIGGPVMDGAGVRGHSEQPPIPSRVSWARLLARVFSADLSTCPLCAGPMKVLDAVVEPSRIAQMLASHAGASARLSDSGDAPSADDSRPRYREPTEAGDATSFSGRTSRGPPPVGQLKLFV